MYAATLFVLAVALPAAVAQVCNANNCARGVTGTRVKEPPVASRQADCANYLTETVWVTPTVTATATDTVSTATTLRTTVTQIFNKRASTDAFPSYATYCSNAASYSSACSCWGFTPGVVTSTTAAVTATNTVTVTTTSVETSSTTFTPAPTCTHGVEYAFYPLSQGTGKGQIPYNPGGSFQNSFDASTVKGLTPSIFGSSTLISYGVNNNNKPVVDGISGTGSPSYVVLQHRFYLVAGQVGAYTITFYGDDIALIWIGPNAVSGWTTSNAATLSQFTAAKTPTTYSFTPLPGVYTPIRVLYANAQTGGLLSFKLTAPDGTVLINPTGNVNQAEVVQSCSGVLSLLAPKWPAWQDEQ